MRNANLEYIGWVDKILGVDYGVFELILLYCTWVQARTTGARATMKQDEYGFTLLKVDRAYSADSFAFPLHVQQVFFAYEVDKPGWKVVLRKQPRGTRVASGADARPEMQCFTIGRDEDHIGLTAQLFEEDIDTSSPVMK
jgi:hypothetical protein